MRSSGIDSDSDSSRTVSPRRWRRSTSRANGSNGRAMVNPVCNGRAVLNQSFFAQPLLEVFLVFLLKRRVGGRAVNLARLVPAGAQFRLGPLVVNLRDP